MNFIQSVVFLGIIMGFLLEVSRLIYPLSTLYWTFPVDFYVHLSYIQLLLDISCGFLDSFVFYPPSIGHFLSISRPICPLSTFYWTFLVDFSALLSFIHPLLDISYGFLGLFVLYPPSIGHFL